MKKCLLLAIPVLILATSCKNDKPQTPKQTMEEASKLPSMHVAASDFTVDVPEGWTTKDTSINGINIFFLIAPVTGTGGGTTINILHEGMQNLSLDQYKQATISSMKPRVAGFELKNEGETEAGDLKGQWFNYKMQMSGSNLDAINYMFPKDNVAYMLTAVTQEGNMGKYRSTFDAVARSFQLK